MGLYPKKNGKFVTKPAYNHATSMVRAKKDNDQENAEDTTANSKNRSQLPIGIPVCDLPYQPLLQQASMPSSLGCL